VTAELPLWVAAPAALLLILGGALALVGAIGLLRLPDFLSRMHPPTMGSTLGAGCVFVASILISSALAGRPMLREVILALFMMLTAPVTAMLLVRAALYRSGRRGSDEPRA
jgi:multicomponent K+:H+ antiporter subunit G